MKYMTVEHIEKLDEIKLNNYFKECVDKLEAIGYKDAFEERKENYLQFVKHVYNIAKKYKLDNKKQIFSLMLLWHVEGDSINQDDKFLNVFDSNTIPNHEKAQYFKNRAIEYMKNNTKEGS